MLSELKLLILENNDIGYINNHLSDFDKGRITGWFSDNVNKTLSKNWDFDNILNLFMWCCLEGEAAVDTHNPAIFSDIFEKKSIETGIDIKSLTGLYHSHQTLFEIAEENKGVSESNGKGRLIVFEGLDGSGKSTQISLLAEKLKLIGHKVYCTAEPTNSATGGLIRDTLSNNYKRDATELAGLFLTDRIAHNVNPVWGIKKFLEDGIDVICDRYYYSSFAYQGLGTDLKWIMDMNLKCPEITKPDLCIFLDVDYKRCKLRVDTERPHLEIFETDENVMQKTRTQFYEIFKKLNKTENIQIINANRSVSAVADDVYRKVMNLGR